MLKLSHLCPTWASSNRLLLTWSGSLLAFWNGKMFQVHLVHFFGPRFEMAISPRSLGSWEMLFRFFTIFSLGCHSYCIGICFWVFSVTRDKKTWRSWIHTDSFEFNLDYRIFALLFWFHIWISFLLCWESWFLMAITLDLSALSYNI